MLNSLCNTIVITEWLDWMKDSNYTYRSMQNYVLALKTFGMFMKDKCKKDKLLIEAKVALKHINALIEWSTAQGKVLASLANKQTKARNSRESLEKNNKWVNFATILKAEEQICEEFDEFMKQTKECKPMPEILVLCLILIRD